MSQRRTRSPNPKSTGPETPIIPGEDANQYRHRETLLLEYHLPGTDYETRLVKRIALHAWTVFRTIRLLARDTLKNRAPVKSGYAALLRYQSAQERSGSRVLALLQMARKTKAGNLPEAGAAPPAPGFNTAIHPEISDRWERSTSVRDPRTGRWTLLKVLRDRERDEPLDRIA